MFERKDWLPVGSAVRVAGVRAPVVIAGCMVVAAGRAADYVGLPLPLGRAGDGLAWFDRADIEAVLLVGYEDARAQRFAGVLREVEPRFEQLRAGLRGCRGRAGEAAGAASPEEGPRAPVAEAPVAEVPAGCGADGREAPGVDSPGGGASVGGARAPWLPIGSVVVAAGAAEPLCILGYRQRLRGGAVYDYCAQVHPRGFSSGRWVLFDRSDVELVLFAGYQDAETDMALARLDAAGPAGAPAGGALPPRLPGMACEVSARDDGGWLPIGSAVRLDGRDGMFVVAGCMVRDAATGRCWDYAVVPYPMGRSAGVSHCDRWEVAAAPLVGYRAPEWRLLGALARAGEEGFEGAKARSVRACARGGLGHGGEGGAAFRAIAAGASAAGSGRRDGAAGAAVCPWLPLGSVVEVEGVDEPLCVLGYMVGPEGGGAVFDLCARPYPEGMDGDDWMMLDRADIARTLFIGYQDEGFFKLARVLEGLDRQGGDARGAAARVPSY